ncbi:CoA-binding protein [Fulvivirga sp. M361]|uniref:CoA-binding protein n=1 Tax=Fulvivirga sp. M361 TaxID=2594266 RepID=UPI00117BAC93|nr:CoA-binding protein [Fulvivirga sp. M361]TRX51309.1 CoA-binding protein [Fulvivirga sp. M361]
MKKTAIIGATTNPSRYAYFAADMLTAKGHEIVPLGIKKGEVSGVEIMDIRQKPEVKGVDTVTLYLGPQNQAPWYDYILSLKPERIIFNPGTENETFRVLANQHGIDTEEACTLVLLRLGAY